MENITLHHAKSILSEKNTVECFMFSSWPWSNAINIQDSSLRQLHLEAEGFTTLQKVYMT